MSGVTYGILCGLSFTLAAISGYMLGRLAALDQSDGSKRHKATMKVLDQQLKMINHGVYPTSGMLHDECIALVMNKKDPVLAYPPEERPAIYAALKLEDRSTFFAFVEKQHPEVLAKWRQREAAKKRLFN